MSGGKFDYIDGRCQGEIFGWLQTGDRIPNVFEDREISEMIYDVFNLIHDYDWYASGDTCKETYLAKKKAFKDKWLQKDEIRVRRIVDEAVDNLRKEMYETYGIEEERKES